jgi:hypothetical protein
LLARSEILARSKINDLISASPISAGWRFMKKDVTLDPVDVGLLGPQAINASCGGRLAPDRGVWGTCGLLPSNPSLPRASAGEYLFGVIELLSMTHIPRFIFALLFISVLIVFGSACSRVPNLSETDLGTHHASIRPGCRGPSSTTESYTDEKGRSGIS